jgi:hypothetical protein
MSKMTSVKAPKFDETDEKILAYLRTQRGSAPYFQFVLTSFIAVHIGKSSRATLRRLHKLREAGCVRLQPREEYAWRIWDEEDREAERQRAARRRRADELQEILCPAGTAIGETVCISIELAEKLVEAI